MGTVLYVLEEDALTYPVEKATVVSTDLVSVLLVNADDSSPELLSILEPEVIQLEQLAVSVLVGNNDTIQAVVAENVATLLMEQEIQIHVLDSGGSAAGGGATDHGALTGLNDDDHLQYLTPGRGDARYSLLNHLHTGVYAPAVHTHLGLAPGGGAVGLVLKKLSAANFDYAWLPDLAGIGDAPVDGTNYWRNSGAWAPANWTNLDGKPSAFPPVAHTHAAADIVSGVLALARLPTGTTAVTVALGDHLHTGVYAPLAHMQDWSTITGVPATFPPGAHGHDASEIVSGVLGLARIPTGTTGTTVALGNHDHAGVYAPVAHNHDHGLLTGLADDDHSQYHTDARGDVRYAPIVHNHDGSYAPLVHTHAYEPPIAAGTVAQYWRGDKTWAAFPALPATLPPSGAAGGVLAGAYPNPGFAVDMATQAELDAAIATREPIVAGSTANKFWNGLKAFAQVAYADVSGTPVIPATLPPSGSAGGVLSGTYPNPGFAVDMATQVELNAVDAAKAPLVHTHAAADTISGTFAIARIPTGTTGTTVALGNHTHAGLLPVGGTIGQILSKIDATNFNTTWIDPPAGGGGGAPSGPAGGDLAGNYPDPQIKALVIVDGDINAAAAIQQSKILNLVSDLAGKAATSHTHTGFEPTIAAGTTAQYWRGDKTWATFPTGGGSTPSGPAGGVLSGTYPDPGFAADMATQAELDAAIATRAPLVHTHAAADTISGVFAIARIPTGTTGTTVALGNHNHDAAYAPIVHTHAYEPVITGGAANRYWNGLKAFAQIAYADISGTPAIPGTLPPSGAAGGDLTGTYPNPTLALDRVLVTGDTMTGSLVIDTSVADVEALLHLKTTATKASYVRHAVGNAQRARLIFNPANSPETYSIQMYDAVGANAKNVFNAQYGGQSWLYYNGGVRLDTNQPGGTLYGIWSTTGQFLTGFATAQTAQNVGSAAQMTPEMQNIGATNPEASALSVLFNGTQTNNPSFIMARSRGTVVGTLAPIVSGDFLGTLSFQGASAAPSAFLRMAEIIGVVEGAPTTTAVRGSLRFLTANDTGGLIERCRIGPDGHFSVGTSNYNASLYVSKPLDATGVTGYGILVGQTVDPGVSTTAYGIMTSLTLTNGVPGTPNTLTHLRHFFASQPTAFTDFTLTNQIGFYANSNLTRAVNNYGFKSDLAAADGVWSFYGAGTAQSAFLGNVAIGSITPPTNALDVTGAVTSTASFRTNLAPETWAANVSPQFQATGSGTGTSYGSMVHVNSAVSGRFAFAKGRGTFAARLPVVNADQLGHVTFEGWDAGTTPAWRVGAQISGYVDAAPVAGTSGLAARLSFFTSPVSSVALVERMRIDSDGAITVPGTFTASAIGGGTPSTIVVPGTITVNGTRAQYLIQAHDNFFGDVRWKCQYLSGQVTTGDMMVLDAVAATITGNYLRCLTTSGTVTKAQINGAGNVQGTGAYTNLSDEKVKENIGKIADPLALVKKIMGRHYKRIGGDVEYGFIAQELETAVPEAVVVFDEKNKLKGVQDAQLIPIMVEAMKQLISRIEILEARV